jgi:hypothetical protein
MADKNGTQDTQPGWLTKLLAAKPEVLASVGLSAEEVEDAKKGYMRDADYTQKSQEVAKLRKIMEANPGLDPEAAIQELNSWRGWRETKWPAIQQELAVAETLKAELDGLKKRGNGSEPVVDGSWGVTAEDFYETQKLWGALGKLEGRFIDKAAASRKEWYEKEVAPAWESTAAQYLGSVLGPMELLWEKMVEAKILPAVSMTDVFKEMAVQGADKKVKFKDVYGTLSTRGAETKESGFKDGYEKGKADAAAEAAKAGTSAAERSGPVGATTPKWTPPPAGTKLTREDRMNSVIAEVTTRKGPLPL